MKKRLLYFHVFLIAGLLFSCTPTLEVAPTSTPESLVTESFMPTDTRSLQPTSTSMPTETATPTNTSIPQPSDLYALEPYPNFERRCDFSTSGDTWGIYLWDFADDTFTRITEQGSNYRFPQFSPDGKYLSAIQFCDDYNAIVLLELETSHQEIIASGDKRLSLPVWSPDGSKLAFVEYSDERTILFIHDFHTGENTSLIEREDIIQFPNWSPDGQYIAFAGLTASQSQIYRVDIANAEVLQITNSDGYPISPAWSPTGDELAYIDLTIDIPYLGTLHLLDLNSGNDVEISQIESGKPTWSPDGNSIFVHGVVHAYRINAQSYAVELEILNSVVSFVNHEFSPDGKMVVLDSVCCSMHQISIYEFAKLEETNDYQSPQYSTKYRWPIDGTWAPDSKTIAFSGLMDPIVP